MTTMDEKSHLIIIYVFRGYDTFMKICSFKKFSLIHLVNLLLLSADSHPCSYVHVQSDSLSRPRDYDQLAFLLLFL